MYQTVLKSINGVMATGANGEKLQFIGPWPCQVGDTVWTDGKVIFGYMTPKASSVPVFDNSGIPISLENLTGYFTRGGKWKNYNIAPEDWIVNSAKYFYGGSAEYGGVKVIDAEVDDNGNTTIITGDIYYAFIITRWVYRGTSNLFPTDIYYLADEPLSVYRQINNKNFKYRCIIYSTKKQTYTYEGCKSPFSKKSSNDISIFRNYTLQRRLYLLNKIIDFSNDFDEILSPILSNPRIEIRSEWSEKFINPSVWGSVIACTKTKEGTEIYVFLSLLYHLPICPLQQNGKRLTLQNATTGYIYTSLYYATSKISRISLETNEESEVSLHRLGGGGKTPWINSPYLYEQGYIPSTWEFEDLIEFEEDEGNAGNIETKDIWNLTMLPLEEGFFSFDKYGRISFFDPDKKIIAENLIANENYCFLEVQSYHYSSESMKKIFSSYYYPNVKYKIYTPDGVLTEKQVNLIEQSSDKNDHLCTDPETGLPLMDGMYLKNEDGSFENFYFHPVLKKISDNKYLFGIHGGKLYLKTPNGIQEVGGNLKNFRLAELKNIAKAKGSKK